jgi:hypothetical protein
MMRVFVIAVVAAVVIEQLANLRKAQKNAKKEAK